MVFREAYSSALDLIVICWGVIVGLVMEAKLIFFHHLISISELALVPKGNIFPYCFSFSVVIET